MLDVRLRRAITRTCNVLGLNKDLVPMDGVCAAVRRKLPEHVSVVHEYTDKTLDLQSLMTEKMALLSSR